MAAFLEKLTGSIKVGIFYNKNWIGLSHFLRSILDVRPNNIYYKKNKHRLGLSLKEFLRLKMYGHWNVSITQTMFFNRPFITSSPYWFLQSIEEIFINEVYKFETLNPKPVIIDCGANWGLSMIYFKNKHPGAIIVGYEADAEIYNIALKNLKAFDFDEVTLYNKAIWNTNGRLIFSSEGSVGGSVTDLAINATDKNYADAPSGTWIGNYNTYFGIYQTKEQEVESIRLKNILEEFPMVDFLKIDIEGAEHTVIIDCEEELHRVDKLFIEYHSAPGQPQLLDEILKSLRYSGFRYYIKEASNNFTHPFIRNKDVLYDLQLNIFCFRS